MMPRTTGPRRLGGDGSRRGEGASEMTHVLSKDGTHIAYHCSGAGPSLVLVHGTGTDHRYWAPLLPALTGHFTVYAVDRRGRGQSGDTAPYAIEREFEDVAALLSSIPGDVNLLGHSYGAICSLEAALRTRCVSGLALYEPPIHTSVVVPYPTKALERFHALLEAGDTEQALVMVYEEAGTPRDELRQLRAQPDWPARIQAAHTIPREFDGARNYVLDADRTRRLTTPTLLLLGSLTTPSYAAATEALHESLASSRMALLPRHGHEAVVTAPALVLQEILGFFLGITDEH